MAAGSDVRQLSPDSWVIGYILIKYVGAHEADSPWDSGRSFTGVLDTSREDWLDVR